MLFTLLQTLSAAADSTAVNATSTSADMINNSISVITVVITIVTTIAGIAAVVFEIVRRWDTRYDECARNVNNEKKPLGQLSAAIQLRTYMVNKLFKVISHQNDATKLVCAILKKSKNGPLQKVLGDSLSCVKVAHGLDLQETNLHQVCIKPQQRVEYEITGDINLNKRTVDLSNSDMYRADLSESTICNVVFDKGIFYDTLLYGTSFHNCSFVGAKFPLADLRGTKFFACDLTGANFKGARRVSKAFVNPKEKDMGYESKPLINYLGKDGIFGAEKTAVQYDEQLSSMTVFVSKLGGMSTAQKIMQHDIEDELKSYCGVNYKSIGRREYRDSGQLVMIQDTMAECNGVVVLAFTHMNVYDGEIMVDKVDGVERLKNKQYSSPWLQIETAFARSMGLPCLIIAENDKLKRNGIFDDEIVKNDDYMYFVTYKGHFNEEDYKVIDAWKRAVEVFKSNPKK